MKIHLLLPGLLLCIAHTLFAQTTAQLGPMEVARIQQVGQVVTHPDSEWAAYTLSVPADPTVENVPASTHLYLIDPETGRTLPFVTSMSVGDVQFRPEHGSLTFLARAGGDNTRTLYEISLEGGEASALYAFSTSISSYDWSSDGQQLAFIAAAPSEAEAESLPYEPEVYEENLSLQRGYVIDLGQAGSDPQEVQIQGSFYALQWSPQDDMLLAATAPTALVDDYYMKQSIHLVDADGLTARLAIPHEGKLGEMAWSPDGAFIAYTGAGNLNDPHAGRLYVADTQSGAIVRLQEDFQGAFESVSWADDAHLHVLASEGVWSSLLRVPVDRSGLERILDTGGPILTGLAPTSKGQHLLVANTPAHPNECYRLEADGGLVRLTNHNEWLDAYRLAPQEVVDFEARDGLDLQGILIRPLDAEADTRYPMVTVVHGGPEAHYSNGWLTGYSTLGQMAAARGMAVFYPNYRGSTGRGQAFAMSSQGDLAGQEFDDIVDGVDHLIETGLVDGDKVGVTGGSYGGYATGWLATRYTDRFAAGVMFVGISNNISKWGTSDIPEELYQVHARKRIWEDYDFFLERSPIYYADQTETPLLIMAGKEDTRVHPSQSIELYRHIKVRTDTPVRLVLYPGEGHGNRRATARYDYSLRSLGWFEKYLKGETEPVKP